MTLTRPWLLLVLAATMVAGRPGVGWVIASQAEKAVRPEARTAPPTDLIERVLAVVAGRVITLTDVTAAGEFGLVPELSPYLDPVRGILTALIERALVLAEVDRYALTEPAEATVAANLRDVRARFSSPEAFTAALERTGLDEGRLREIVRENERIRAYLNQRFPGVPVGDEELRRYFDDHHDRFGSTAGFEDVRGVVVATAMAEQRRVRIAEWVEGLRDRTEVTDLWVTER